MENFEFRDFFRVYLNRYKVPDNNHNIVYDTNKNKYLHLSDGIKSIKIILLIKILRIKDFIMINTPIWILFDFKRFKRMREFDRTNHTGRKLKDYFKIHWQFY